MAATTYQIGETVYIPYTDTSKQPTDAVVAATESVIAGGQTDYYMFENMSTGFKLPSSLVFEDAAALETYTDNLIDSI